jgi:hypothetical protein
MIQIILSAALILLLQEATPYWWWVMVVPFTISLVFPTTGWRAFRMGAISAGAVWILATLVLYLTKSDIIAVRIASMVNLGNGWMLVLLTGIIGMAAGGVGGVTGEAVRSVLRKGATTNAQSGRSVPTDNG